VIFKQLFDNISYTYTYLIAGKPGGEALIIDPVLDKLDHYLRLFDELDVKLVKAIDTHIHADHITALGALRDTTQCITVMGMNSSADVVSMRVEDGDSIDIDGLSLTALYTPGHTDDSFCFLMDDRVFTGDTLFIRGTGRTDFQQGNPTDMYRSIQGKLLTLPDDILVYPGHDYKGDTVSTIGEERAFNPRLQVSGIDEFVHIMDNLNLPDPKLMDIAVPANQAIGMEQSSTVNKDYSLSVQVASQHINDPSMVFVDLREDTERQRYGVIPGSIHLPYVDLQQAIELGGLLHSINQMNDTQQMLLYCAYGERSVLALHTMQHSGYMNVCHMEGGVNAWKEQDLPLTQLQSS